MDECIFCKLAKDKSKHIYKDETCYVVLDIHPASEAHILIISNDHYESILEAPEDVTSHMFLTARNFFKHIQAEFKPVGGTVVTNRGPGHVYHFHVHVIPRYTKTKAVTLPRLSFDDEKAEELRQRLKLKK